MCILEATSTILFLMILKHKPDYAISLLKMLHWFPHTEKAILTPCHGLPCSGPCLPLRLTPGSPCSQIHQAPATAAFLLFLKDTQLICTLGPLHLLFHVPGILFSQLHSPTPILGKRCSYSSLSSNITSPKSPTLTTPSKVLFQPTFSHHPVLLSPVYFSLFEPTLFISLLFIVSLFSKP